MINELLAAAILSTSFSVRTPNNADVTCNNITEEEKQQGWYEVECELPLDYEFMVKAEKTEGNFTWSFKRDWEREQGEKYKDNVWKFDQKSGILYGGMDYVDKESKDIKYIIYNLGLVHKSGLKMGVYMKDQEPLFSAGFNTKIKKDKIELYVDLSLKESIPSNTHMFNVKTEIKKWFTEKINIFALYKHEYYNKKEDLQFKVGVGVKL